MSKKDNVWYGKWAATATLILATAVNSLGYYPLGPIIYLISGVLWIYVSVAWREPALIVTNVVITTVGAVGLLTNKETNDDGTKTLHYRAEDVIDFAWTASPKFAVYEDKWEHVDIHLLIQPDHEESANRYLESAKYALQFFNDNLAQYPYTTLTIVR